MVATSPINVPAPRPFEGKGRLIGKVAEIPPATNETAAAMGDLFRSIGGLFARLTGKPREEASAAKVAERQKNYADRDAKRANDWQAEAALNDALSRAWRQHGDDPAALDKALGAARQGWLDALVAGTPEERAEQLKSYGALFDLRAEPFRQGARDRTVVRRRSDATAGASALRSSWNVIRDSARLAANSDDGDRIVAAEVARAGAQVDGMLAARVIDPATAAADKRRIAGAAVGGRAMAEFDRIADPDAKAAFADDVLKSWESGKGPLAGLDEATVRGIAADLSAEATAAQEQLAAAREADDRVARFGRPERVSEGFGLIANGKLSVDWLSAHANDLPPIALASFERALDPSPPGARDVIQRGALARTANAGGAVEDDALALHAGGLIGTDDLQRVGELARGEGRDARAKFDLALAPPASAPAVEHEQHWQDTLALAAWQSAHPQADDKARTQYLDRFIAERGAARRAARRARLPLPAFAPVPQRTAMTDAAVVAAKARTKQLGLVGTLSDFDAGREARLLTAWTDSVERDGRRG
jgi:hypothetical protein